MGTGRLVGLQPRRGQCAGCGLKLCAVSALLQPSSSHFEARARWDLRDLGASNDHLRSRIGMDRGSNQRPLLDQSVLKPGLCSGCAERMHRRSMLRTVSQTVHFLCGDGDRNDNSASLQM